MTDDPVRYDVADGVVTVTLDSPANRNALSRALVAGLTGALDDAAADPGVRVVVLTHTGTTFCAGADLREALADGVEATSLTLVAVLRALVAHRCPVVAVVDGHVRAGGTGMVAACDVTDVRGMTVALMLCSAASAPMKVVQTCTLLASVQASFTAFLPLLLRCDP